MPRNPAASDVQDALSSEDRDCLIGELAGKIVRKGLETPAVLFLEMHKPVSFLASQTMLVASPLLAPIFSIDGVERYSALFADRGNVELLIRRIEELADDKGKRKDSEP